MGSALIRPAPVLDEALALSRQGLPCFPCSSRKNPTTPHGYKDATRDSDVLRELWRRHPGPLIGVATGETSGLNVLDIDARHGGAAWFARHRSDLPSTRVHRTRGGGLHLLFQYQAGVGCSAGRIAAGVDVRGSGGYAIWWPAAGLPVLSDLLPAAWPEWLLSFVSPPVRPASPIIRVPDDHTLMKIVRLIAYARPGVTQQSNVLGCLPRRRDGGLRHAPARRCRRAYHRSCVSRRFIATRSEAYGLERYPCEYGRCPWLRLSVAQQHLSIKLSRGNRSS
jgi:hypothetical protein